MMGRRRVDIGALIKENATYGISVPMIAVATGFTPANLKRLQKQGSVIVTPKRDSPADRLDTFTGSNQVLAKVLPPRFVYQWWQRPNAILDFHRPLDVHIENPRACRQAAVRYAEEHPS